MSLRCGDELRQRQWEKHGWRLERRFHSSIRDEVHVILLVPRAVEVRTKKKRLSFAVVKDNSSLQLDVTRGPPDSVDDMRMIHKGAKYRVTSLIVFFKGLRRFFLQRNLKLLKPLLQFVEVRQIGSIENLDFMKVAEILLGEPFRDVSASPSADFIE